MPHNVSESDTTFPANVSVPDPGEPVVSADMDNAAEPLARRTRYLKAREFARRHFVSTVHSESYAGATLSEDPNAHFTFGDDSPPCAVGDRIEVDAVIMVQGNAGSTGTLQIAAIDDADGTPTAAIPLVGATMTVHTLDATPMRYHVPLRGHHIVTEAGQTKIVLRAAAQSGIITVGAGVTIMGSHGRDPEA